MFFVCLFGFFAFECILFKCFISIFAMNTQSVSIQILLFMVCLYYYKLLIVNYFILLLLYFLNYSVSFSLYFCLHLLSSFCIFVFFCSLLIFAYFLYILVFFLCISNLSPKNMKLFCVFYG